VTLVARAPNLDEICIKGLLMHGVLKKFTVTTVGLLLTFVSVSEARAQQPDNAGAQILRQTEPQAIPQQSVKVRPQVTVVEPMKAEGPSIAVKGFSFDGNQLFKAEALAPVVQRFVGQGLTLAELQYAADLIGKYYQDQSYVARVVVPEQDVVGGIVRIQILESRLDKVEIDASVGGSDHERMQAFVGAGLKSGDNLNLRRIERGTLLLNQLPGTDFQTVLRAGSSDGTSSVVVVPALDPSQSYSIIVDRAGSSRSGQERVIVNASAYPIATFGDEFSLTALASRGVQYGRAGYSLPIGSDGLSANLALSGLRYSLLNSPVKLKGHSAAAIFGLRYPALLQFDQAVILSFEGGYRTFSDSVVSLTTKRNLIYGSAAIDVTSADKLLAGGSSAFGINVLAGRTAAQGSHVRLLAYINRRQNFTKRDAIILRVSGQVASEKLDPSQLMMINGTNGVAAFSNDEDVSGRSGVNGRVTFEHSFARAISASVFYDFGKVYGASANRPTTLRGVGLGATWRPTAGLAIDASVGRPISPPDAFNNSTKTWVSARLSF
jgi:hemolysin activation/secretion protein